jgi:ubiquinone biosynthesis protein
MPLQPSGVSLLNDYDFPTPLIEAHDRPPVQIISTRRASRWPALRLMRVFGRFWLTNLRQRIGSRLDPEDRAIRLREAFEEAGGLWIKVGQLISLRTDMLSEPVCRELSRLQYRAQGFAFSEVEAIVSTSLGAKLSTVFSSFDRAPLAAASISQVHCAVLRSNGARVAVKVLRPDAEQVFRRDLKLIWLLVTLLVSFRLLARFVHLDKALEELDRMVLEELDFRYEAANMRRMRKTLRSHRIYVPKVFRQFSSRHVLVSEFISGVLMSDFIRVGQSDPVRLAAWCQVNRVDQAKLGRRLFESAMTQMFEDNLFHADLHPGNIILMRDNRVALIDFGTIGSFDQGFLTTYKASLAALAEKDYLRAADLTLTLAIEPPAASRLAHLRTEMVRSYRQWEARTHLSGVGYHERSLAAAGGDVGRIMFAHKVQMSWQNLRLSRTWGTLDASLSFLIPQADYMKLFSRYFRKSQARRLTPRRILSGIVAGIAGTVAAVDVYGGALGPIVRKQVILAPSTANVPQRILNLLQSVFRYLYVFSLLAVVVAGVLWIYRVQGHRLERDIPFLANLSDEALDQTEMWGLALLFVAGLALVLRAASKRLGSGA